MGDIGFDELQRASDRQRFEFLRQEVELCNVLCNVAETEFAIGERDTAVRTVADAERGCKTVERFLADPRHGGRLAPAQARQIQEGLEALRARVRTLSETIR